MKTNLLILFTTYFLSSNVLSQTPYLVKDIDNKGNITSFYELCTVNSTLFFTIFVGNGNIELWKTDGTETGTQLVKRAHADKLTAVNNTLFFSAEGGLWKTDGTQTGTVLVKETTQITLCATANNFLFFVDCNWVNGCSIWKSDGTELGTVMVKEGLSYVETLTNVNDTLFFTTTTELWKSDGTEAGTTMIRNGFSGYSANSYAINGNGILYFVIGSELWQSDGTNSGTSYIRGFDIGNEFIYAKSLTAIKNKIYYVQPTSYTTEALYANENEIVSFGWIDKNLLRVNDTLYFQAGELGSGSLWKLDATNQPIPIIDKAFDRCNYINGNWFFTKGNDQNKSFEIWTSNGTTQGTKILKTITDYQYNGIWQGAGFTIIDVNGTAFFTVPNVRVQLWKSDGTEAGTVKIKINTGTASSYPSSLTTVNDALFFTAGDGVHGRELWKSNGTEATTILVKDIGQSYGGNPSNLRNVNNTLFFIANDRVYGDNLWKSDGTQAGTLMVKNIAQSWQAGNFKNFLVVKNSLFFTAYSTDYQQFLVKSDGTSDGTTIIKSYLREIVGLYDVQGTVYFDALSNGGNYVLLKVGGHPDGIRSFNDIILEKMPVNNTLFFAANDGVHGYELWKSDGTQAGTVMVKDINISAGSSPINFAGTNNTLFFVADDGVHGYGLWKSDGTEAGTVMIKDIGDNSSPNNLPANFFTIDNALFFTADDGVHGRELWKSDGTEAGTVMVKDIFEGSNESSVRKMFNINGILFFFANDGLHGRELWKSDGTQAGTVMVKEIFEDSNANSRDNIFNVNGTVFFYANDGIHGNQLWKTDGNEDSTVMITNIKCRYDPSAGFAILRNNLFFTIDSYDYGNELWCLKLTDNDVEQVKYVNGATVYYSGTHVFVKTLSAATIQIFDVLGREVTTQQKIQDGYDTRLNIERAGIYLVKITTDKGVSTHKISIQ